MATKITGTNTAAAPGVTGDDTDTGLFYGTNEIGFSTGGTSRLTLDSSGYLNVPDSGKIRLGTGNDLEINHSSNISTIKDGYGDLRIMGDTIRIQRNAGGENFLYATEGGKTSLFYDGTERIETTSTGINVDGTIISMDSGTSLATFVGDSNRSGANQSLLKLAGKWNGTEVSRILLTAGSDTTNKDDGAIRFDTTISGGSITERMQIASDGKVHINRTTALDSNYVNFSATKALSAGIPQNQINIGDAAAYNTTDNGGAIGFSAIYSSGGAYTTMASIEGVKTNNTDGNYNGDMVFKTRSHNGNNVTRMRLTDAGLCFGSDTAAPNALSDYEEGLFTATMGNGVTLYTDYDDCTYVKVGNLVTVAGELRVNDANGGSVLKLTNLPFATKSQGTVYPIGSAKVYSSALPTGTVSTYCQGSPGTSNLFFGVNKVDGTVADMYATANGYFSFSYTYLSN